MLAGQVEHGIKTQLAAIETLLKVESAQPHEATREVRPCEAKSAVRPPSTRSREVASFDRRRMAS